MQNFCLRQLSMQILLRRRCSRVVDLKLPIIKPDARGTCASGEFEQRRRQKTMM